MDSGYYAAMTGLVARSQALDTAASNLANAQTPGYRAEREYFRSVLLGPDALDSQLGRTVNNYGLLGGDTLNMAQGALQQTGNPLDLAIEGQGFFAVQTKNGIRYTRDGSFHRSQQGVLMTAGGDTVLSVSGKPIALPPGEPSVGADGSISIAGGVAATLGCSLLRKARSWRRRAQTATSPRRERRRCRPRIRACTRAPLKRPTRTWCKERWT